MDLPINSLVGTRVPGPVDDSAGAVEYQSNANALVTTGAGVEWIVAAIALGALGFVILFKLAGFRAAIAVKGGIG